MKKIILYTEDIPVKDGVVSTGLARVNSYFVEKLGENLVFSFFFNKSVRKYFSIYGSIDARAILNSNMFSHGVFFKLYSFFVFLFVKALNGDVDRLFTLVLNEELKRKFLLNQGKQAIVFAPVGVDYTAIHRAKLLANSVDAPLAIYLVDDPIANMRILGVDDVTLCDAKREFSNLLKQAQKIYVISEGLKECLQINYGCGSCVMSLPYIEKHTTHFSSRHQNKYIVFVGNTSHFYQEGLNELAGILSEEQNEKIRLVFTIGSDFVLSIKSKYPNIVDVVECKDENELASLVKNAALSFLPYSFSVKYFEMVSTSFPSKFLDYCSWAKRILIYAPPYSVSAKLAGSNNLPYTVTINDKKQLKAMIFTAIKENDDYSTVYSSYLKSNHIDFDFFAEIVDGL